MNFTRKNKIQWKLFGKIISITFIFEFLVYCLGNFVIKLDHPNHDLFLIVSTCFAITFPLYFLVIKQVQEKEKKFNNILQNKGTEKAENIVINTAVKGTQSGTWSWNIETGEVYFSPEWKLMLGYVDDEIMNNFESWKELLHPDDLGNAEKYIEEFLQGKRSTFSLEFRLKQKNGQYKWVLSQAAIEYDQNKQIKKLFGLHIDINEFKEKNFIFEQFIQTINEVFWMTDPTKNKIIYISPGYEKIWGRSREELYQNPMSFIEGIHPDDREEIIKKIQNQITEKYNVQYRVVRPDGTIRWVNDRSYTVKDEKQQVYKIIGVATDVTYQIETQNELEEFRAKAFHSSKMASLGEMAAGIAHEINNPLSIINGNVALIKKSIKSNETLDQGKILRMCNDVESTSNRISKIITGLRTFSRSNEKSSYSIFELFEAFEVVKELCNSKLQKDSILISFECDPEIILNGNKVQIEQVLINLINNACDAIVNTYKPWIKVVARRDQNHHAIVSVTDSGKGIPEEIASKIMQPFFTTKEVGKGTGLGLSISSGIISEHGGSLSLDRDSKNTSFIIQLPEVN